MLDARLIQIQTGLVHVPRPYSRGSHGRVTSIIPSCTVWIVSILDVSLTNWCMLEASVIHIQTYLASHAVSRIDASLGRG